MAGGIQIHRHRVIGTIDFMRQLNQAMLMLAAQPRSLFIGQGVAADGVATYADFEGVPMEQRIEFPIAEELNVGYAIGLAMMGYLPVVCIPRVDFLLRAADAIINHLDKIEQMSVGQWNPKVIIRTRVGSKTPLDAGPQHTQRHTEAFRHMLTNVNVWEILRPSEILPTYECVTLGTKSSIIVEVL
jgi:pyruvate dehydrogenase E1 component beta subunit